MNSFNFLVSSVDSSNCTAQFGNVLGVGGLFKISIENSFLADKPQES